MVKGGLKMIFWKILSNECNVCTFSEMLAILSSAINNTCLDIVPKWRLDSTFQNTFP